MKKGHTIVAGAGLAGLTAALELQRAGFRVTLLEANTYIGGRTASWDAAGMEVESGLHRVLGFYKALPWLIRQAGLSMKDVVIWEDEIEFRIAGGPSWVYGASPVFNPLETLSGPFRNSLLSWKETFKLSRFFLCGIWDYFTRPRQLDEMSVLDYANRFNLSPDTILRVLTPLTAGLFFFPPERYSAFVLFALGAQGMKRLSRTRVGAFAGGMSKVLADPVAAKIESLGGSVLRGMKVERLIMEQGKASGVEVNGAHLQADHVVLATPLGPARDIIRQSAVDPGSFSELMQLPTMPEVNLQLELSSPAWPADRAVFCPGSPLITLAEQSRTTFRGKPGRLSIILSPPERFLEMTPEEVFGVFCSEAPRLGIDPGKVVRYRVVSHSADFYQLSPGNEKLKPGTVTAIENLFLAGDYVRQPFLATMEGAIISGRNAAMALERYVQQHRR